MSLRFRKTCHLTKPLASGYLASRLIAPSVSIALLFRYLSASRLITIAQIEGRVRSAGSEFVLACDMRFAARELAIFSQPEPALGVLPGGGASQNSP